MTDHEKLRLIRGSGSGGGDEPPSPDPREPYFDVVGRFHKEGETYAIVHPDYCNWITQKGTQCGNPLMAGTVPRPFPLCGAHFQKLEDFFRQYFKDQRVRIEGFDRSQMSRCQGSGTRRYRTSEYEGQGVCHECGNVVRINTSGVLRAH
jgi:hypothetical protein